MSNALIPLCKDLAIKYFGADINVDEVKSILRNTVFKGKEAKGDKAAVEVTDEQLTALLIISKQYGLNPFTKEIYAYPDKQGIVPVVGVDGWSRIINSHPKLNGIEFNYSENLITIDGLRSETPDWIECIIYKKDQDHPIKIREYLREIYRPPFRSKSSYGNKEEYTVDGPWQTHTMRLMRHKALIQCARVAFGFTGIYDEDEADRIKEAKWQSANEIIASISHDPTPELLIEVNKAKNLGELKEVFKKGSQLLGEAKIDNQEFKNICNQRKKELLESQEEEKIGA